MSELVNHRSLSLFEREVVSKKTNSPPAPPRPAPPARTDNEDMNATCLSTRPSVRGRDGRGAIGPSHGPTHRRSSHVMPNHHDVVAFLRIRWRMGWVGGWGEGEGEGRGVRRRIVRRRPLFHGPWIFVHGRCRALCRSRFISRGRDARRLVSVPPPLARRIARAYYLRTRTI